MHLKRHSSCDFHKPLSGYITSHASMLTFMNTLSHCPSFSVSYIYSSFCICSRSCFAVPLLFANFTISLHALPVNHCACHLKVSPLCFMTHSNTHAHTRRITLTTTGLTALADFPSLCHPPSSLLNELFECE